MTVREMRDRLFHIDDQTVAVRRVLPAYAKYTASPNETVEQMRHRLFNLEPQDGPIEKAKDATDRRASDIWPSHGKCVVCGKEAGYEDERGPLCARHSKDKATDRRARMHKALDAVLDGRRAKDGIIETDPKQALKNINSTLTMLQKKLQKQQQQGLRYAAQETERDIRNWLYDKSRAEKAISALK